MLFVGKWLESACFPGPIQKALQKQVNLSLHRDVAQRGSLFMTCPNFIQKSWNKLQHIYDTGSEKIFDDYVSKQQLSS